MGKDTAFYPNITHSTSVPRTYVSNETSASHISATDTRHGLQAYSWYCRHIATSKTLCVEINVDSIHTLPPRSLHLTSTPNAMQSQTCPGRTAPLEPPDLLNCLNINETQDQLVTPHAVNWSVRPCCKHMNPVAFSWGFDWIGHIWIGGPVGERIKPIFARPGSRGCSIPWADPPSSRHTSSTFIGWECCLILTSSEYFCMKSMSLGAVPLLWPWQTSPWQLRLWIYLFHQDKY